MDGWMGREIDQSDTHTVRPDCSINWPISSYPILSLLPFRNHLQSPVGTKQWSLSSNMLFSLPEIFLFFWIVIPFHLSRPSFASPPPLSLIGPSLLDEIVLSLSCITVFSPIFTKLLIAQYWHNLIIFCLLYQTDLFEDGELFVCSF